MKQHFCTTCGNFFDEGAAKLLLAKKGGCPIADCNGAIGEIDAIGFPIVYALHSRGYLVNDIHIGRPTDKAPYMEIILAKGYTLQPLPQGFDHTPYLDEAKRDTTHMRIRRDFPVLGVKPLAVYKA